MAATGRRKQACAGLLALVAALAPSASCHKPSTGAADGPSREASAPSPSTTATATPSAASPLDAGPRPADPCRIEGARQPFLARFSPGDVQALATAMDRGIAVVAADDCHGLRLLRACTAHGRYGYLGTVPTSRALDLGTEEELRVNAPAPMAAATDGGTAFLHVDVTTVGQRATTRGLLSPAELSGSCEGATHFVQRAHVGVFARRGGGAPVPPHACAAAHPGDANPPSGCGSLVNVRLVRITELGDLIAFNQAPAGTVAPIGACPASLVVSKGRCVRPPTTDPFLCSYGDEAQCRAQCNRGDVDSCDVLGFMRTRGPGAAKDAAAAIPPYAKSCEMGDAIACDNLGALYLDGSAVATDAAKAGAYFQRACDFGSADACGNLGTLYRTGEGLAKDEARGLSLTTRACDAGSVGACMTIVGLQLGTAPDAGAGASAERGVATLTRLCDEDSGTACFHLGRLSYLGESVAADRARASTLFEKACRAGEDEACVMLGLQYRQADGVARDDARATPPMDRAWQRRRGRRVPEPRDGRRERQRRRARPAARGRALRARMRRRQRPRVCLLGRPSAEGSGVPQDEAKARAAYAHGCDQGEKEGCTKAR